MLKFIDPDAEFYRGWYWSLCGLILYTRW